MGYAETCSTLRKEDRGGLGVRPPEPVSPKKLVVATSAVGMPCCQEGNQNDRVDARKLAPQLLHHTQTEIGLSREPGYDLEGAGWCRSYPDHHQRPQSGDTRGRPSIAAGHSVWTGKQRLCIAAIVRVAREDQRTGGTGERNLLSATRRAALLREASAAGPMAESKKHQAWKMICQIRRRTDAGGGWLLGILPTRNGLHKEAAMDHGGSASRPAAERSPCCERAACTKEEAVEIRGLKRELQSRLKNSIKGAAIVARDKAVPRRGSMRNWGIRACGRKWRVDFWPGRLPRCLIVWKRECGFDDQTSEPKTAYARTEIALWGDLLIWRWP